MECGVAFVFIDRCFPDVHFVGADDVRIRYLATKQLIRQGYCKVPHLCGPNVPTAVGRLEGYLKALRDCRMRPRKEFIVEARYHEESGGYKAMKKLLQVSQRPDAVLAASDPIAIGALDAL